MWPMKRSNLVRFVALSFGEGWGRTDFIGAIGTERRLFLRMIGRHLLANYGVYGS